MMGRKIGLSLHSEERKTKVTIKRWLSCQRGRGSRKDDAVLLWGAICVLAESRYEPCCIQSAESCFPPPALGPPSGVDVFHVEGERVRPLALGESVKQFLPPSLASVSSPVNPQMLKRTGVTFRKILSFVLGTVAKTLVIRVITFSELGGFQDLLEQKQVEWRRNPSRVPTLPCGIKGGSSLMAV